MKKSFLKRPFILVAVTFIVSLLILIGAVGVQNSSSRTIQCRETNSARSGICRMLWGWERYLTGQGSQLGLNQDQLRQIDSILSTHVKHFIKTSADLKITRFEIREMLVQNTIDVAAVEAKVKSINDMATGRVMESVRSYEKVLAVLTPEQREKAKRMIRRMLLNG